MVYTQDRDKPKSQYTNGIQANPMPIQGLQ